MTSHLIASTIPAGISPTAPTVRKPVREAWRSILAAIDEMNYAVRRTWELNTAPLGRSTKTNV